MTYNVFSRTLNPTQSKPPNSAQLGGIPYHSPKLHPGACNSVGMRPQSNMHTDARDCNTFRVVYDSHEV